MPGNALGRVAVLMGGDSAEREISLRSGSGVLAALQRSGVDAIAFDPLERPLHELRAEGVDRVFIALHGRWGEDGTVQGALELMRMPYTGSGVMASSLAMNKPMTKRLWSALGLPTPAFEMVPTAALSDGSGGVTPNAAEICGRLGLPLAVKPACEGSSLGFTRVDHAHELLPAVHKAAQFDDQVIIEAFIDGREFTVALLEQFDGTVQALPSIEIVAPSGNYDYQNKYFGSATKYLCPAPIAPALESRLRELSLHAFSAVQARGWARVDLMLSADGAPMLLEINTSPGMTDHSLVPMAAAQAGLSYEALVLHIAGLARLHVGRVP